MLHSLPKALLLDLDDTILDFSSGADPCWQKVCQRFAPQVGAVAPETLFDAIKEFRTWFWGDPERHRRGRLAMEEARREIVAKAFARLQIDAPALANQIADAYGLERENAIRPFPGAVQALRHLQEKGVRLALITNGDGRVQRRKLERFELAPLFDCVLIEGEFGLGKPDQRVYRFALDQLKARPEEAWMVGDHLEWDVAAPQRLGIRGIWLDHTCQGLPESSPVRPHRIIRSLTELIQERPTGAA